ncbi:MAG: hypothetical protein JOZ53_11500 [Planctomycetaceae bacterium]|nr:hypothetical protein [Planctomycetaceae bacterium]
MKQDNRKRGADLAPRDVVRVETALSRFPIHRLARKGTAPIEIRETGADGELTVRWEVGHHSKYGQPGPLAYRLDTWVINRRIEEVGRPVPGLIRIGSLSDFCRRLDLPDSGKNIRDIKRALHQNASAYITAKVRYKTRDGAERWIEIGTTRYTVVMTGETLPDGRRADAVYLLLHDFYRQILDSAATRPLDYGYLRDLPPASQRLYELLSYPLFGALRHGQPKARMRYSEFCTYAPQTRHATYSETRKQMARVLAPHLESGYLTGVEYEPTTDRGGRPDWAMIYTPGPKAKAEYRAFTGKGGAVVLDMTPTLSQPKPEPKVEPEPTPPERALIDRGVTAARAAELVRAHPERVAGKLEVFDRLVEAKDKRIAKNPAGFLVKSIAEDYPPPPELERARRATAERATRDAAEQANREATAREREERDRVRAYWEALPAERQVALDAAALDQAAPADRAAYAAATAPQVRRMLRAGLRDAHIRRLLGLPAAD